MTDDRAEVPYFWAIIDEIDQRCPTGAIFLNGLCNLFSRMMSFTKWEGFDAFEGNNVQWLYYVGSDGAIRYEHRSGFVFRQDSTTKTLLGVPENPRFFYPNRYFLQRVCAIKGR